MSVRSFIYVPADDAHKLEKALKSGADAIIIDLEDAVPIERKEIARSTAATWLENVAPSIPQLWVRLNSGPERYAELAALVHLTRLTGVAVAKVKGDRDVHELDDFLTTHHSSLQVIPQLESAAAVLDARAIAGAPRVAALVLGEVDLRAELGIPTSSEGYELLWARSQVVLASAAAGIAPPIASTFIDVRDSAGLLRTTEHLKGLGFWGRTCIHPIQIATVNECFTPSAEEVAQAQALIQRFTDSNAGVALDEDGRMIDAAVIRSAQRTLSVSKALAHAHD